MKLAWELASQVLMRSLDDVQPQTRRLLLLIDKMVTRECERLEIERLDYRFTRATVRQHTGWSDSQLKTHLHRLGGPRIPGAASRRAGPELRLRAQLRDGRERQAGVAGVVSYGAKRSGFEEGVSGFEGQRSGSSLGRVWGVSGGGADSESSITTRVNDAFSSEERKTHR